MSVQRYFLVTSLPTLGELGSTPPLSLQELLARTADQPNAHELVQTVVLSADVQLREAFLAGEIDVVEPAVLTEAQARNEQPLPPPLADAEEQSSQGGPRERTDRLWAAYYQHADELADRLASGFLKRWVSFEVSLRNALAAERAAALGLEPANYLVVPHLGLEQADFSQTLAEWVAARNPLEGLRVLDRRRWSWLHENDAWFSFDEDEVAAYAAKLLLLVRWQRLAIMEQRRQ